VMLTVHRVRLRFSTRHRLPYMRRKIALKHDRAVGKLVADGAVVRVVLLQ
jgi:hypothetical protein